MREAVKEQMRRLKNGAYSTQWLNEKSNPFVSQVLTYRERHIETELPRGKMLAVASRAKDLFFTTVLSQGKYSFRNPLVVLNPYGIAPLSAIILFTTKQSFSCHITVHGKAGAKDLVLQIKKKKTCHRIPVTGLYPDFRNKITIELLEDEEVSYKKTIVIQTGPAKEDLKNAMDIRKNSGQPSREYIYVSGGFSGNSYIFDSKGEIRFYFNKKIKSYGTYQLSKGRFLFSEHNIANPTFSNPHTTIFHEMDFMGRVYGTFLVEKGIHHFVTEKTPGGNLLALSSTLSPNLGMENCIIEIHRETGAIVKELDLNTLFDETYRNRQDWAHVNSIQYLSEEDAVLVSLRNLHSIGKIRWSTQKLQWILGDVEFWKKSSMMDVVLKPEKEVQWFYQQHAAQIIGGQQKEKELLVFDNHVAVRRLADQFQPTSESYLKIFVIDEERKTVSMKKKFSMNKSGIRSNGVLLRDTNTIFGMAGCLRPKVEEYHGMVYEFDYESGKVRNEYGLKNDFFSGYPITFETEEMSKPLDMTRSYEIGKLREPVMVESIKIQAEGFEKESFSSYLLDDILLLKQTDHEILKIYAIGTKYQYMLDETVTWQRADKFRKAKYYITFPLSTVQPDEYRIYIETINGMFELEDKITIKQ